MTWRDPYDPSVAFDDVTHLVRPNATAEFHEALKQLLKRRLRMQRLRSKPSVRVLGYDVTPWSFSLPGARQILGGEEILGLGLFSRTLKRFRSSMPRPRAVRVDDAQSYREFRQARREPQVLGAGNVYDFGELPPPVSVDMIVGLDLPPRAQNAATAWQEGPEVLVTICVIAPDGERKFATSGAPVAEHVDEVVDAAEREGVEPQDLATAGPIVPEAAAESVLVGLAEAAPVLARCDAGFVGALDHGQPEVAATMALIQAYQRGNKRAGAELAALWHSGQSKMLKQAGKILSQEQSR